MTPTSISYEFNAQYVKDLSFENPAAPKALMMASEPPQVQIDIQVDCLSLDGVQPLNPEQGTPHEVTLTLRSEAKRADEKLFIIELAYAGIFTVRGGTEEQVRALLMVEAPRMLFPFARALVANLTREGGFPPLLLNPVDFAALAASQAGLQNA